MVVPRSLPRYCDIPTEWWSSRCVVYPPFHSQLGGIDSSRVGLLLGYMTVGSICFTVMASGTQLATRIEILRLTDFAR